MADKERFVLDLDANPHPDLLHAALVARKRSSADRPLYYGYWLGMLDALISATGTSAEEINAWLDSHETNHP